MLFFTKGKEKCTGCTACQAICQRKCITMEKDNEGFLYPKANNQCIHCGKCEHICPIINPRTQTVKNQKAYCVASQSHETWKRSSSGGAFSELCRAFGEDAVFFGASLDELVLHHKGVTYQELPAICKSKYIASDMGDSFRQIQKYLDDGKKVLFCGTPCQVAGLSMMPIKNKENLILIDFICHGVGSNEVFRCSIQHLENQYGKAIANYEFRHKDNVYYSNYITKLTFVDHRELKVVNDPYMQLFLAQICLRPSCGSNCQFRTRNRHSDITLADMKGLYDIFPDKKGEKINYSTVIVNTPKGQELFDASRNFCTVEEYTIEDVERFNPLFSNGTELVAERDNFFEEFTHDQMTAVRKWTKPATRFKKPIIRNAFDLLPVNLRKFLMRL